MTNAIAELQTYRRLGEHTMCGGAGGIRTHYVVGSVSVLPTSRNDPMHQFRNRRPGGIQTTLSFGFETASCAAETGLECDSSFESACGA